jgi:hypothetical protein
MAHNPRLADKQGLDETTREVIDKLHIFQEFITESASETNADGEPTYDVQALYKMWYETNVLLQKLWKFDLDEKYIKFWEFPRCTCPKMDNDDNYPSGYYVTVQNCIYHGWEDKK